MIAIVVDHTKIYYAGANDFDYYLYVYDALTVFFFLSGYLFYQENGIFDLRHKLSSILRRLVIPYFLFTAVLALPKTIGHGQNLSTDIFWEILLGQASWFVAALISASLLFSLFLLISKQRIIPLAFLAVVCYTGSIFFPDTLANPWHIKEALMFLPYILIGFCFHRYEQLFRTYFWLIPLTFILYITGKCLYMTDVVTDSEQVFQLYLIIETISCVLFFALAASHIRSFYSIEWIGRKSIFFYFLCGGVPFVVTSVMNRVGVGYDGNILHLLLCIAITIIVISLVTFIIDRWAGNNIFIYLTVSATALFFQVATLKNRVPRIDEVIFKDSSVNLILAFVLGILLQVILKKAGVRMNKWQTLLFSILFWFTFNLCWLFRYGLQSYWNG